jgi:hypothetical protein
MSPADIWEDAMNELWILAYVIMPVLVVGMGVFAVWLSERQDHNKRG